MKKLGFMLAMMVCIFASCSDGGSEEPVTPTPKPEEVKTEITIDSSIISNGLSFDVAGSEQSVSFSVNANWTLSVASTTSGATWCKASATSGSKGSATVKFSVDENTGYDDRSVSVTIKAGSVSKTFTITQKGADALLVTTTKYEVAQEGGQIEIEVKANISYQMEISEDARGWITEAESKGRALTTHKHKLDIALNENTEKREGEITFKSGDKVESVKVYQAGGALILLSQNEYTVSDTGETISVDIKSNVEYGVQMPDVNWISDAASGRGMSSHTLKYVVEANEGYDSRSAEIIFYDKNSDLKDTLKVVQAQKDAIVISKKEYEIKAEGETIEVKLSANVDFEVTMPEVDWITQAESRSLTEHTLYFKVAENTGEEERTAEICINNTNSKINEIVKIKQSCKNKIFKRGEASYIITIKEPGTLENTMFNYKFDYISDLWPYLDLKIIGNINRDDIKFIRDRYGADNYKGPTFELDLSEASIVEKEIPRWAFFQTNSLSSVILPNDTISIGYEMFSHTSSIKKLTIGKNVLSIGYGNNNIDTLYITDLSGWCNIDFEDETANPMRANQYYINNTEVHDLEIPENVTKIKDYTFYDNSFKKIIIPDHVTTIGDYAFYSCRELTEIHIGKGITKIGKSAIFCSWLINQQNPTIHISDLTAWCNIDRSANILPGNLYLNGTQITELIIPSDVKEVKNYAFQNNGITKVTIPDNITSIGHSAFDGCRLSSISIGKSVVFIGSEAFYNKEEIPIEVYCYATTPPRLSDNSGLSVFNLKPYYSKLYVPKGTKALYENTGWYIFHEIIEMEE